MTMRVGLNLGAYAPLADVMAVWQEADAHPVFESAWNCLYCAGCEP